MSDIRTFTIIGGGDVGQYEARMSLQEHSNVEVRIFESDPVKREELISLGFNAGFESIKDAIQGADLVSLCVPAGVAKPVLKETLTHARKGITITDQFSRKQIMREAIDSMPGLVYNDINGSPNFNFISSHIMANPRPDKTPNIKDQRFIIVRELPVDPTSFIKFSTFRLPFSNRVHIMNSFKEHDIATANTQVNTARQLLSLASAYGEALKDKDSPFSIGKDFMSRMQFAMAMRVSIPHEDLYGNIIFGNELGNDIVQRANDVEEELFGYIDSNQKAEYFDRVLGAVEKLFLDPSHRVPILEDSDISQFGSLDYTQDSHLSLISYLVERADSGSTLFDDYRAGTPNFDVIISLVAKLCHDKNNLEKILDYPFSNRKSILSDLKYHHESIKLNNAILHMSSEGYSDFHSNMQANLRQYASDITVLDSTQIVGQVRQSLARAPFLN